MGNIIDLIKKEMGPGLMTFACNPHIREAEASRVQGHSELHIDTQSKRKGWQGRDEGRRENTMVEEREELFSKCTEQRRSYLLGFNQTKFGPFLFQSSRRHW